MSKIIDALDKARFEGTLEPTVGIIDERTTLGPVTPQSPGSIGTRGATRRKEPTGHRFRRAEPDAESLRRIDAHLEAAQSPMSVIAEQYRGVRSRLERLNFEGQIRALALTSAVKGEGKSLTACNLALTLAQDATKRVLLVDADLRKPSVHKLLGIGLGPGLVDMLAKGASLDAVLRDSGLFGLAVVTAGETNGEHPSELLASPAFGSFIGRCRADFDYVLLDCPPIHPISDVSFLLEAIDGVVLVVRAGKTSKGLLKEVVANLPAEKLVGTVLNRAEAVSDRYGREKGYYGYGYGYGDRNGKG